MSNSYRNGTLFEPTFFRKPPHHPFNEQEFGCVDGSFGVIAIPVPIGHPQCEAPYARGAVGWKYTDWKCSTTAYFTAAIHLLTAALHIPGLGTPVFEARPGTTEARAAQLAYIRRIFGRESKKDRDLLGNSKGRGIRHDYMFDRDVADIIHAVVSGAMNAEIPGMSENVGNGEDDLRDGVAVDNGRGGRYNDYDDDGPRGRGRRGRRDEEEEDEDEVANEMDAAIVRILDNALTDAAGHTREGQHIIDKIKFVIVHYERPKVLLDGTRHPEEMEDAGCIVYGFIMDPLLPLGGSFSRVIEMCEEHRNKRMGVSEGIGITTDADAAAQGQGFKRARFASTGPASALMRHFPWLADAEHSENGLLHMTKEFYLEMVSFIRNDPAMVTTQERNELLARGIADPGTETKPNKLHPLNVFTPEWATSVMRSYGVSADDCSVEVLRQRPQPVPRAARPGANPLDGAVAVAAGAGGGLRALLREGRDGREQRIVPAVAHRDLDSNRWYLPPRRSYQYLMSAMVWARNGYAGLHQQYFPWIEVPSELARLSAAGAPGTTIALYSADNSRTVLSAEWRSAMVREGVGIVSPLPVIPFDPDANTRSSAIIQIAMENSRVLDNVRSPRDPENTPDLYKIYAKKLASIREACMMRARQVLTTAAPINAPMRAILTWMGREMRCASTYLPQYDMNPHETPDTLPLDPFANYMVRQALQVHYVKHIVGPARHWVMVFYGAQDCHATMNVGMHFSCIFHGPSQTGKSFLVSDATETTCIPGSVNSMLESSNRSFNTHDDFTGWILFKDEVDNVIVDGKAAANDKSGLADRLKSMLTSHKVTYHVLTFVDKANGKQRREAEDIETLFHATLLCCTNKKVGAGDEALASRFLNFVVTRSECRLYEYMGVKNSLDDEDAQYKSDCTHAWRVKQALLALVQALVDMNVLPEPSMDAYDRINSRFLSYLGERGVDTSEIRSADMSKRLARIYTILNAIIINYDVPGAPYMNKEFEMGQLLSLIPYLYCTQQITFFTLTQTGEMYTHPTRAIVLNGAFSQARLPFTREKTIETYFKEDLTRQIQWRRDRRGTGPDEQVMMNFNYIQIKGKYRETILPALAEHCMPKLGVNEVDAALAALSKVFIKTHLVRLVDEAEYKSYNISTLTTTTPTREAALSSIPAVVRDFTAEVLYVAVEALSQLNENMLVDAIGSCIHPNMRAQNYLLGTHITKDHPSRPGELHYYNQLYRTIRLTPNLINDMSVSSAFSVPDVSFMPPVISAMSAGARLHPDKAAAGETYSSSRKTRANPTLNITEDIDDWAHRMHHYRAGCAGSHHVSPSRQIAVYNSVKAACLLSENAGTREQTSNGTGVSGASRATNIHQACLMIDYPEELMEEIDMGLVQQEIARSHAEHHNAVQARYKNELEQYKMLPPDEKRRKNAPQLNILSRRCDHEAAYKSYLNGKKETDTLYLTYLAEKKAAEEAGRPLPAPPTDGTGMTLVPFDDDAGSNSGSSDSIRKRKRQERLAARATVRPSGSAVRPEYSQMVATARASAAAAASAASTDTPPASRGALFIGSGSGSGSRDGSGGDERESRPLARYDKRSATVASRDESRDALGESLSRGGWGDEDAGGEYVLEYEDNE